jgi:UDP:flavonoid glycosyltransferase YjiC (YdhE family)
VHTERSYRRIVRILFTVYGTRPHIYPLVPLAWAFRSAGHEVRLTSTPNWADAMIATGLPTVTVGGSPRVPREVRDALVGAQYSQPPWPTDWVTKVHQLDRAKLTYLESLGRYLVAAADAMVDDLVVFATDWAPDAIVYDGISYAGPVAAGVTGALAVRHLTGTDSAQRLELTQPGPEPLPEYAKLFERFGVAVRTEGSATVDPTPPSMRLGTAPGFHGMRYVPYNGPGLLPDGLTGPRSRPRVCVTWGHSMSNAIGADGASPFVQAILASVELGMDCLVAAPPAEIEGLGRLPDSVRALTSAPLHRVLPHCDAIVHHGGDGTALTAATVGIPQLVITGNPEGDLCAGRLASNGAGTYLCWPDLRDDPASASTIRNAMDKLLSDSGYAEGAQRLREEIERQPTPADVAAALAAEIRGRA